MSHRFKSKLSTGRRREIRHERELEMIAATIPDQEHLEKIIRQVRGVFQKAVFDKIRPFLKFHAAEDTVERVRSEAVAEAVN